MWSLKCWMDAETLRRCSRVCRQCGTDELDLELPYLREKVRKSSFIVTFTTNIITS